MPFIGVNPPAARVTSDAGISSQADAGQKNMPGQIAFYKDSSGRISVLRYVQAFASIVKGAALMQVPLAEATTTGISSAGLANDPVVLHTASVAIGGQNMCKGFAAADVSNTGYWFWSYIAGYCPDAAMPTAYNSGQPLRLSASYAGRLSSAAINVSTSHIATWTQHIVAVSLGQHTVSTANSTNAIAINGWLG